MDVPEPVPAAGEALVALEYAGVNFIDVHMRSGHYARSRTYQMPPTVLTSFLASSSGKFHRTSPGHPQAAIDEARKGGGATELGCRKDQRTTHRN